MSLISWLIWLSSLATGSGDAGPDAVGEADDEGDGEPDGPAPPVSTGALVAAGGAVEVSLAWRGPHADRAQPSSSAAPSHATFRA